MYSIIPSLLGACVSASVTCNNGHTLPWCSSDSIDTPKRQVKTINLLLVLHIFLAGISFEKVEVGLLLSDSN